MPTTATIRLTDTVTSEVRYSMVTVRAPTDVEISPASTSVAAGGSVSFSATGGSGSYTWSFTGSGTRTGATYHAPWATETATFTATDTNTGDFATATINVSAPSPVQINPSATINVIPNDVILFSAAGGSGTYTWNLDSGPGTLVGSTYTADGVDGTAVITVQDTPFTDSASATVIVTTPLVLTISPKTVTLNAGDTITFTNSTTVPPYTYSQVSGGGTLAGSTYTAPWSTTTAIIRVTDSDAPVGTDEATVTVNPPPALSISPATATLNVGQTVTFTGSGGSGSSLNYAYTKVSGGGTLVGAVYTAPGSGTTAVIRLSDTKTLQTSDATVTVSSPPPVVITPAAVNVLAGNSITFTGSGGSGNPGNYVFSKVSGSGTLAAATYTSVSEETAVIRLTDSLTLDTADATVIVYSPLTIFPTMAAVQIE